MQVKKRSAPNAEILRLHLAAEDGDLKVVRYLLKRGAPVEERDERGYTPLMLASAHGHSKVVSLLLSHGAAVDATDERGHTALMLAARTEQTDLIACLLNAGAALEARNWLGETALNFGAQFGDSPDAIGLLLKRGADIETRNTRGYTPLVSAAAYGQVGVLRCLLAYGARMDVTTEDGHTALSIAALQSVNVPSMLLSMRLRQVVQILGEAGVTE